ncbi:carboxypeptidase regulatory-like domain-containing protein [Natrinema sp. H-ect1]|uniref:carboxypeptidase regulatory-like domain-containing protein n=1 Tax=Natrinema sp. H-ect1 TaxID=3242700 RepID=UPI00359CF71D
MKDNRRKFLKKTASVGTIGYIGTNTAGAYSDTQGAIIGTVTDASQSTPVANVTVDVKGSDITMETNDEGEFGLLLEEGTYELTLSADGYQSTTETVDIVAGDHKLLDFELSPSETGIAFEGLISDIEGSTVENAHVFVQEKETSRKVAETKTDSNGTYTIPFPQGASSKSVILEVSADGYETVSREAKFTHTTANQNFSLSPKTGTIVGNVSLEDGYVRAEHHDVTIEANGRTTKPAPHGDFELVAPSGTQSVKIRSENHVNKEVSVDVTHGGVSDIGAVQLSNDSDTAMVSVSISGEGDSEISNGLVTFIPKDSNKSKVETTGEFGIFEAEIPAGDWTVRAEADGFITHRKDISVEVNQHPVPVFRMTLWEEGSIGTLTGSVDVQGNSHLPSQAIVKAAGRETSPSLTGGFDLDLVEGEHDVTFTVSEHGDVTKTITINAGETTDIGTVSLEPIDGSETLSVDLDVPDGDSNKLGESEVRFVPEDPAYSIKHSTTDEFGLVDQYLPPGTWTIEANPSGYALARKTVDVSGSKKVVIDLDDVGTKGTITGNVDVEGNSHLPSYVTVKAGGQQTSPSLTGDYELTVSAGSHTVEFLADNHADKAESVRVGTQQPETVDVTLENDSNTGQIFGKVRDQNGSVAGASVHFLQNGTKQKSVKTDEFGLYETNIEGGNWTVEIDTDKHVTATKEASVDVNQVERVDFDLKEEAYFEISVEDTKDAPIADVDVTFESAAEETKTETISSNPTTVSVSPGDWAITATRDGFQDKTVDKSIGGGQTKGVNLTLSLDLAPELASSTGLAHTWEWDDGHFLSELSVYASQSLSLIDKTETENPASTGFGNRPGYEYTFALSSVGLAVGSPSSRDNIHPNVAGKWFSEKGSLSIELDEFRDSDGNSVTLTDIFDTHLESPRIGSKESVDSTIFGDKQSLTDIDRTDVEQVRPHVYDPSSFLGGASVGLGIASLVAGAVVPPLGAAGTVLSLVGAGVGAADLLMDTEFNVITEELQNGGDKYIYSWNNDSDVWLSKHYMGFKIFIPKGTSATVSVSDTLNQGNAVNAPVPNSDKGVDEVREMIDKDGRAEWEIEFDENGKRPSIDLRSSWSRVPDTERSSGYVINQNGTTVSSEH